MSEPGADIRTQDTEPAATRMDARVPSVADWQRRRTPATGDERRWPRPAARVPGASLLDGIIEWCPRGRPNEACGLLAGPALAVDGGSPSRFLPLANAAASPYRYLIDPDEQLRACSTSTMRARSSGPSSIPTWGPRPFPRIRTSGSRPTPMRCTSSARWPRPPLVRAWSIRDDTSSRWRWRGLKAPRWLPAERGPPSELRTEPTGRPGADARRLLPDVLVPDVRVVADELAHELLALAESRLMTSTPRARR